MDIRIYFELTAPLTAIDLVGRRPLRFSFLVAKRQSELFSIRTSLRFRCQGILCMCFLCSFLRERMLAGLFLIIAVHYVGVLCGFFRERFKNRPRFRSPM